MNAEKQLQQTIVQGIDDFLDRAQYRIEGTVETLPFKTVNGHVVINWLRARLNKEIGPDARFRLLPKRAA